MVVENRDYANIQEPGFSYNAIKVLVGLPYTPQSHSKNFRFENRTPPLISKAWMGREKHVVSLTSLRNTRDIATFKFE